jgi:hypothetical protein
VVNAWRYAKTLLWTLVTKEVVVASRQCIISHFLLTMEFLTKNNMITWLSSQPTLLFSVSLTEYITERLYWGDLRQNPRRCWTPSQNTASTMHLKNGRSVGNGAYKRGRGLLRGWWWPACPKLISDQMEAQVPEIMDGSL